MSNEQVTMEEVGLARRNNRYRYMKLKQVPKQIEKHKKLDDITDGSE